jgi:hypothetical protein
LADDPPSELALEFGETVVVRVGPVGQHAVSLPLATLTVNPSHVSTDLSVISFPIEYPTPSRGESLAGSLSDDADDYRRSTNVEPRQCQVV